MCMIAEIEKVQPQTPRVLVGEVGHEAEAAAATMAAAATAAAVEEAVAAARLGQRSWDVMATTAYPVAAVVWRSRSQRGGGQTNRPDFGALAVAVAQLQRGVATTKPGRDRLPLMIVHIRRTASACPVAPCMHRGRQTDLGPWQPRPCRTLCALIRLRIAGRSAQLRVEIGTHWGRA
eukprot:3365646-Pleurochrysis_carterae.AAC.1